MKRRSGATPVLVAAVDGRVLVSRDAAATFEELPGFAGDSVTSFDLREGDLMVATDGYGLFRIPLPD